MADEQKWTLTAKQAQRAGVRGEDADNAGSWTDAFERKFGEPKFDDTGNLLFDNRKFDRAGAAVVEPPKVAKPKGGKPKPEKKAGKGEGSKKEPAKDGVGKLADDFLASAKSVQSEVALENIDLGAPVATMNSLIKMVSQHIADHPDNDASREVRLAVKFTPKQHGDVEIDWKATPVLPREQGTLNIAHIIGGKLLINAAAPGDHPAQTTIPIPEQPGEKGEKGGKADPKPKGFGEQETKIVVDCESGIASVTVAERQDKKGSWGAGLEFVVKGDGDGCGSVTENLTLSSPLFDNRISALYNGATALRKKVQGYAKLHSKSEAAKAFEKVLVAKVEKFIEAETPGAIPMLGVRYKRPDGAILYVDEVKRGKDQPILFGVFANKDGRSRRLTGRHVKMMRTQEAAQGKLDRYAQKQNFAIE